MGVVLSPWAWAKMITLPDEEWQIDGVGRVSLKHFECESGTLEHLFVSTPNTGMLISIQANATVLCEATYGYELSEVVGGQTGSGQVRVSIAGAAINVNFGSGSESAVQCSQCVADFPNDGTKVHFSCCPPPSRTLPSTLSSLPSRRWDCSNPLSTFRSSLQLWMPGFEPTCALS